MSAADTANPVDVAEISKAHAINDTVSNEKEVSGEKDLAGDHGIQEVIQEVPPQPTEEDVALNKNYPTPEDFQTLRRMPGTVHWPAYTVAFVELCERFSYYGTTIVCKC